MQTLKPCPFCGNEPSLNHMGTGCYTVSCSNGHHINTEASKEKAIAAWNARPAAPVEGLEHAGWQRKHPTAGWLDCREEDVLHYRKHGQEVREVSPRSQAEAIIAAKDAEIKRMEGVIDWENIRRRKAEADNAALTARVKELRIDRAFWEQSDAKTYEKAEALETQLAAARKALKAIDEGPQIECIPDNDVQELIRAALEAKP